MNQQTALNVMLSGRNVLLTGPAGSGKTFVLDKFIKKARGDGKIVASTATTGLAASHLNGITIHSWAGIGINDYLPTDFMNQFSKKKWDSINKTDVLIIDEISMLHDFRLDMVDYVCREVRRNDSPFGGLQVILCGDFFQLPPINRKIGRQGGFIFHSPLFKQLNLAICYLDEQYRQNDDDLTMVLDAIRENKTDDYEKMAPLERRIGIEPGYGDDVTRLYTTNANVDEINNKKLEELSGDESIFYEQCAGEKGYVQSLKKSILAPEALKLRKGAFVMAIKNGKDYQYVNGSLGFVTDFDPRNGYPIVDFLNGKSLIVERDTWQLSDGNEVMASVSQMPLKLAWAMTIHKSQGMTLDKAEIDLRRSFVEGLGYVALSRIRKLQDLYLDGIDQKALKVSDEAIYFDKILKEASKKTI